MTREGKKRHGCLTIWLVLMILANAAATIAYVVGGAAIGEQFAEAPPWVIPMMIVAAALNVVWAIALFYWKKWGFYGAVVVSLVVAVLNLALGLSVSAALSGLVGVVLLYIVLQIGTDNKGWSQLE